MRDRTYKVIIEFPTPEAALAWFDEVKGAGHLPERADLFEADAMDLGRAHPGDYIARNKAERPPFTSLRALVEERDEAAVRGGEQGRQSITKVRRDERVMSDNAAAPNQGGE